MSMVAVELSRAANAAVDLNESAVRTLFGRPSGIISMADGYGKSRRTYATWDPANKGANAILQNGNLTLNNNSGSNYTSALSTVSKVGGVSAGKWYWETTVGALTAEYIGYAINAFNFNSYAGSDANSVGYYPGAGWILYNGAIAFTYPTAVAGDIIGIAMDLDGGQINFYKNGVYLGSPTTGITNGTWFAANSVNGNYGGAYPTTSNFGATALAYPVAGYNPGLYV